MRYILLKKGLKCGKIIKNQLNGGVSVKKLLCVILCLMLVLSLGACAKKGDDNSASQQEVTEPQNPVLEGTEESNPDGFINAETPSVNEENKQEQPENNSDTTKEPDTPSTETNKQPSQLTVNVTDPENTRGLSTARMGFSYGVAKDGQPHSQSVLNQRNFDAMSGCKALALDTKTTEKVMYLTFDNGYEYNNLTANILDTLKEKKVKAAFFVLLSYAKQNPTLVRRMIDEGHIVGNHSATHPSFPSISRTKMAEEIITLDNYLRQNFSYSSNYFRFPSGEYSECALELVTSIGFKSVFWSSAYADWDTSAQKGADNAFKTVTDRFHNGAVILLHAVSQDNADALGRIIDEAHRQGYVFKTLDDYEF